MVLVMLKIVSFKCEVIHPGYHHGQAETLITRVMYRYLTLTKYWISLFFPCSSNKNGMSGYFRLCVLCM